MDKNDEPEWKRILHESAAGGPMVITELGAMTAQLEETYLGFLERCFTPAQSIYLTAVTATGNPGIAPSH